MIGQTHWFTVHVPRLNSLIQIFQLCFDIWTNLRQAHARLELVAHPIEQLQDNFTHMVEHCHETYHARFRMIGQFFLIYSLICVMPRPFFAFVAPPSGWFEFNFQGMFQVITHSFLLKIFKSWNQRSKTFSTYTNGLFLSNVVHKLV